jgi:hypothetical protein
MSETKKDIKVNIFELISSHAAVATDDGNKLFDRIKKIFDSKNKAILDFNNIELITSTFLNSSIGRLYGYHDTSFIKEHLSIINLSDDDLLLLKKVIERAKEYFAEKEKTEKGIKETLGDEEDN